MKFLKEHQAVVQKIPTEASIAAGETTTNSSSSNGNSSSGGKSNGHHGGSQAKPSSSFSSSSSSSSKEKTLAIELEVDCRASPAVVNPFLTFPFRFYLPLYLHSCVPLPSFLPSHSPLSPSRLPCSLSYPPSYPTYLPSCPTHLPSYPTYLPSFLPILLVIDWRIYTKTI